MEEKVKCHKTANPYTGCCLRFDHENDVVLHYMSSFAIELKRVNGCAMEITGEDAKLLDRYCSELSAYLSGRIIGAVKQLDKD